MKGCGCRGESRWASGGARHGGHPWDAEADSGECEGMNGGSEVAWAQRVRLAIACGEFAAAQEKNRNSGGRSRRRKAEWQGACAKDFIRMGAAF